MFVVVVVIREALRHPPGLLLPTLVVGSFLGLEVVAPAGVAILRNGASVCQERLQGAGVFVRQIAKAARQVRRRGQAMALAAGRLVRRTRHGGAEEALAAGQVWLSAGGRRIGRGPHVGHWHIGAAGHGGAMTDERGHKICREKKKKRACVSYKLHLQCKLCWL